MNADLILRSCPKRLAFTRIELLAVCAALALLALAVAPAVATNKADSERATCFNNLRLIGRSVQMWTGDHNQQIPCRTPVADGGLLPPVGMVRAGNAWFEFAFLSNQLVTPRILACPSDAGVKQASDFSADTEGGFIGPNFRANALSYVVGVEAMGDFPRSWLSGDRNLGGLSFAGSCPTRIINLSAISGGGLVRWTNGVVHGEAGHILLMDGSVKFTSTPQLKTYFFSPQSGINGTTHFLGAR
jgi:competence protein ComGC